MGSRSEFGGRSTADIPENGHNPEVSHGADEHRRKQHHHEPAADVQREGHGGETEPVNEKRTGVPTATASRTARVHGVPAEEETENIRNQGEEETTTKAGRRSKSQRKQRDHRNAERRSIVRRGRMSSMCTRHTDGQGGRRRCRSFRENPRRNGT
jgi:hypothetical protein